MPLYMTTFRYTSETWARLISQPRGPQGGCSVVLGVCRWKAPRVVVRPGRTRRLRVIGDPRQRVHGGGFGGALWQWCA